MSKLLILLSFPIAAFGLSEGSIIKTSPLVCGALSCRTYSLEKAAVTGTVIRVTTCTMRDGNGNDTNSPCTVEIKRDITHGSIAQAIQQFDDFVGQDDGD